MNHIDPRARYRLFLTKQALLADHGSMIAGAASLSALREFLRGHIGHANDAPTIALIAGALRPDLGWNKPSHSTQEIVWALAYVSQQLIPEEIPVGYATWYAAFLAQQAAFAAQLPENIATRLPFSEDVAKLVYAELTGAMEFSRPYVLSRYEREYNGKPYLLFPGGKPRRLLVLFSGNAGRKTYNRYSWYWDKTECWEGDTAFLFLADADSHWYVGRSGENDVADFSHIISSVLAELKLTPRDAVTIGASMGGYGALFYGIRLGLAGVIAVNPQLCFASALEYKEPSWETKMRECGTNFCDLVTLMGAHGPLPAIYLETSDNPADVAGLDDFLLKAKTLGGLFVLNRHIYDEHETSNPTQQQIATLVDLFLQHQGWPLPSERVPPPL